MPSKLTRSIASFFLLPLLHIASAQKTTLIGFVTMTGNPTEYRVNDVPVHCRPGTTENIVINSKGKTSEATCPQRIYGEGVTVSGVKDSAGVVTAKSVEEARPVDLPVQGTGITDRVLTPFSSGRVVARADGYPLTFDGKTDWDWVDTDGKKFNLSDMSTNVWITYKGMLHPDGTVSVQIAGIGHNSVSGSEDRLRKRREFKPEEVQESDRQNAVAKALIGTNVKRLPAYKDEDMQRRIREIGRSLIPAYQRALPEDDPTKITFRFQLVDQPKMLGTDALANGIILVPYQVVRILPEDSEIAAILAYAVANVLEKQAYRTGPAKLAWGAAGLASTAAGFLIPGAGAASILTGNRASAIEERTMEECSRASLGLMHDAGYDIRSAPVAWWMLDANRRKLPLARTEMPYKSQYLYTVLGTTWSQTTAELDRQH